MTQTLEAGLRAVAMREVYLTDIPVEQHPCWQAADKIERLEARNARLLAILKKFRTAMDMHLGNAHETAICEADDLAREVIVTEEKEQEK